VIAELMKIADALRAGWSAGRAVMDGRTPVDNAADLLAWVEACACPNPRVVLIHNRGTYCGDQQSELVQGALFTAGVLGPLEEDAEEVLDELAHEADRRDGVRRGPR
jgi:hypothetical protein